MGTRLTVFNQREAGSARRPHRAQPRCRARRRSARDHANLLEELLGSGFLEG